MKINKNAIIGLFSVGLFLFISNQVKALTANAVDRIAFRIKDTTPIINEDRNTINMDWLKELRFNSITQRYGTGADMDLKTEQGIADARYAIWKSDTVQKAWQAYAATLPGDKQGAMDRFMNSIERGLQELNRIPFSTSTQSESEGGLTDRDTLPTSMRTVRGPSTRTESEGGLTDGDTLPTSMRTIRGTSPSSTLSGAIARDIIKNDQYKGRRLTGNNKAELQWIVSLVDQLRAGGVAINLNDPANLKSLSELILIMSTDKLRPEVEGNGKQYNILVKGNIQQSIASQLETILDREQNKRGIEEGPFPMPNKPTMEEEGPFLKTKAPSMLSNAKARDIIKNDQYKGRRLNSNNEAELAWIQSLVQQLRKGGIAIDLYDSASLNQLSSLIIVMLSDSLKREVEERKQLYNLILKGKIQQSINRRLQEIRDLELTPSGTRIQEGAFPMPKRK